MKKTVFSIFVVLFILTSSPKPVSAFVSSELDCFQMMVDVTKTKEELEWGKKINDFTTYPTEKKILAKKDRAYCQTQRVQKDGTFNPVETVRITYFQNVSETDARLQEFRGKEDSAFTISAEDANFYMGSAARDNKDNFGFNYARGVRAAGSCLIEYKYSMDRLFDSSFDPEGKFIKVAEISVKNILEGTRDHSDFVRFCGGEEKQVSQMPVNQKSSVAKPNPFNIFGSNPYETWLNLLSLLNFRTDVKQGVEIIVLGGTQKERDQKEAARNPLFPSITQKPDESYIAHVDELLNRSVKLNDEVVKKAQADWDAMFPKTPFRARADIVDGQVTVKYPGEQSWRELRVGDQIPNGSTIFTGMDTKTILSIQNKGAIEVLPFTEVTVSEEGLAQAGSEGKTSTDVKLKTGEVEIQVDGGYYIDHFRVQTPSAVAGVRGTHFWVSYNKRTNASVVGVYKGTVAVTDATGGQEVSLTPNGDTPGVAVIMTKQSNSWILGVIVVVLVGAVVWFLKRRRKH